MGSEISKPPSAKSGSSNVERSFSGSTLFPRQEATQHLRVLQDALFSGGMLVAHEGHQPYIRHSGEAHLQELARCASDDSFNHCFIR